jgi:hypothetical protein
MPDPVKAPPRALVEEFEINVILELADFVKGKKKRKAKLKEACKRLAYIQAFLKHNEIEIK